MNIQPITYNSDKTKLIRKKVKTLQADNKIFEFRMPTNKEKTTGT